MAWFHMVPGEVWSPIPPWERGPLLHKMTGVEVHGRGRGGNKEEFVDGAGWRTPIPIARIATAYTSRTSMAVLNDRRLVNRSVRSSEKEQKRSVIKEDISIESRSILEFRKLCDQFADVQESQESFAILPEMTSVQTQACPRCMTREPTTLLNFECGRTVTFCEQCVRRNSQKSSPISTAQQFVARLVEKINDLENLTDSTGVSSSELAANLASALSETAGKIPCGTSSASTLRDIDELRNKAIVHVSSTTGAETADVALCNTDELHASNEEEISNRPDDVHHFAASHRTQGRTTDAEQDFQFKMSKMSAVQQISILTDPKFQTEKENVDLTKKESVVHELVKEKEEVVLMNRSGLVAESFSFSNNRDNRPGIENVDQVIGVPSETILESRNDKVAEAAVPVSMTDLNDRVRQKLEVQGTPSLNCRPFDLHGSSTITSFDCSSTPMRGKTPISIMEMLNPAIETRKGSPSIMSPRTAIFGANRAQLQPPPNTLGWVRSGEEPFPKGWVRTVSRPVDTSKLPPALRQQMIVHDKANTGRTAAIQAGKESTCAEADKQAYVPASILSTITAIGAPSRQLVEMKPMKILSVGANRALLSTILCDSSGNISFPRHVASNLRRSYDCASPVNLHHNEDTGVGESYHRAISESHDRFPDVVAGRGGRNANGMCGVHTFLPERNLLPEPRLESRFLAGILSPQPKRDSRPLTRRSPYLSIPSIDAFMHECSYSDDMNAQVGVTDGFDEDGSRLRSPSAENVSPFLMPHRRLNHSHYTHHESTSEYLKISKQYSEDLLKGSKLSQSQAGRRSSLSKRKPSETGLGNEKMSAIDGTRHDGNVLLEGRETAGKLPFSNRIFTRLSVHRNAAFSDGAFRSDSTMLKVDVMPHVKRMSCPTSKQSIICDMTRRIAVQQKVLIQMASAS